MIFGLLADLVLAVHLAFILFVVFGGLLVLRRRRLAWLHVPAVAWGTLSELLGVLCPLTPLETALRLLAGETGYAGGFIEHYVAELVYPPGLTRGHQIALGLGALLLNLAVYGFIALRRRRSISGQPPP